MHYPRVLQILSIYFLLNSGLCNGALPREEIFSPLGSGFLSVWGEFQAHGYTGILPYVVHDGHTYYVMIKKVNDKVIGRIVVQNAQGCTTRRYFFTYNAGAVELRRPTQSLSVQPVNNPTDLPPRALAFINTEVNKYAQ